MVGKRGKSWKKGLGDVKYLQTLLGETGWLPISKRRALIPGWSWFLMLGCPWAHREINIRGHVFGPNHVSLAEHHTESMKCHNLFIINMLYFCVSGEDLRYPMEATLQRSNDSNALTSMAVVPWRPWQRQEFHPKPLPSDEPLKINKTGQHPWIRQFADS